jgi:hypothetical protein
MGTIDESGKSITPKIGSRTGGGNTGFPYQECE